MIKDGILELVDSPVSASVNNTSGSVTILCKSNIPITIKEHGDLRSARYYTHNIIKKG